MKSYIILVLTVAVGFDFVVTNTVLKQTVADKELLLSENNDSSTNHEETLSNNSEIEQKNIETNEDGETIVEEERPHEETLEIDIEEKIKDPKIDQYDFQEVINNQIGIQEAFNSNQFNLKEDMDTDLENEFELVKEGDYYYNDVLYKDPNEVMDTAAGFVPIPIFRKKQKQPLRRRQYATRRRYNRRPYANRRQYYFYPYYRYYRPSSLRYYYY